MRPSTASTISPADVRRFAEDVEYYLSLSPRQLPSEYLYDDLGSALFEAICHLPWYPITRAELSLLEDHGRAIVDRIRPITTLVELGPGSGAKLATLLDSSDVEEAVAVHLVDISASALDTAAQTVSSRLGITVGTHQANYEAGLIEAIRSAPRPGRALVLFLGSNIGNFDPPGAAAFLRNIRTSLVRGDALLLGADLVKSESELLLAYDDPLQVTAAFNRNLLVRANRELGADFEVAAFSHRAIWNGTASRMEMHLVAMRGQRVRIPAAQMDVTFEPGETIWTESSYKYRPEEVIAMLERAGFARLEQWVDPDAGFALTLARAR